MASKTSPQKQRRQEVEYVRLEKEIVRDMLERGVEIQRLKEQQAQRD